MSSMNSLIRAHSNLTAEEEQWLTALVDEWEMLGDLSFSDLILWVPDVDDNVFWAVAQNRPTTGPTALDDDVVGDEIAYEPDHLVTDAYLSKQICATSGNKLHAGIPVDVHAIPVRRRGRGRVIGIVEMHTNRMGVRAPGELEDTYLETADLLRGMLMRGEFPMMGEKPVPWLSPQVGDGSIRVSVDGVIQFSSPNALSGFRRIGLPGDLFGDDFADVLARVQGASNDPVEEPVEALLKSHRPREFEIENSLGALRLRIVPLRDEEGPCGHFVMCRDTTDLRSRERQLVTKDATIREIHHRVKNNLQTVAALLRLQARRISSHEAQDALNDAMKRVGAIAVVHEILSQAFHTTVNFDDVADRLMTMVRDVSSTQSQVTMRREGTFGQVPADVATNLSLVFTEICQNAIEHGLAAERGTVIVRPQRVGDSLWVDVINDGESLPPDFDMATSRSLGLSIVTTLVSDLGGTFSMESLGDGFGTRAHLEIPMKIIPEPELDER